MKETPKPPPEESKVEEFDYLESGPPKELVIDYPIQIVTKEKDEDVKQQKGGKKKKKGNQMTNSDFPQLGFN